MEMQDEGIYTMPDASNAGEGSRAGEPRRIYLDPDLTLVGDEPLCPSPSVGWFGHGLRRATECFVHGRPRQVLRYSDDPSVALEFANLIGGSGLGRGRRGRRLISLVALLSGSDPARDQVVVNALVDEALERLLGRTAADPARIDAARNVVGPAVVNVDVATGFHDGSTAKQHHKDDVAFTDIDGLATATAILAWDCTAGLRYAWAG